MAARRLRIGVTGLGRIGWQQHCPALAKHRDFTLAAVADPDEARRREAAERFGTATFRTHDEMLAAAALDAVVIAAPTHLHLDMALAALRSGRHVLLEKPMAADLADARRIAAAARRGRRVLTVYQPHRVAAYFQHTLRLARSGVLGEVYHLRRGLFNFARRDDWQALRRFGGGMLNNYAAHALDQLLALTGSDVTEVFCQLRRVASLGDAEDVVKIVYRTRAGALAEVDINQATASRGYELELIGTRGVLWKQGDVLHVRRFDPRRLPRKALNPALASTGRRYPRDDVAFREEEIVVDPRLAVDVYADFARAIRTRGVPLVRPAETLAVMRLMARCRAQAGRILATPLQGSSTR